MESYHGHHISSEDRLFMSQPPSVQPQGTFVLTVQAGQVIIIIEPWQKKHLQRPGKTEDDNTDSQQYYEYGEASH